MRILQTDIPESFKSDLDKAKEILLNIGCSEVYLFGSLADGTSHDNSDIDLAVKGCPPDKFYVALGSLLMELNHSVDLVDLDNSDRFSRFLQNNEELVLVS